MGTTRKDEKDDSAPPALAEAGDAPGEPLKVTVRENMSTLHSAQVMDCLPSIGSLGHPVSCSLVCKYSRKPKGCKDGRLCSRCHICRWKRPEKKDDVSQSHSAKTILRPERQTTSNLVPAEPLDAHVTLQRLSL